MLDFRKLGRKKARRAFIKAMKSLGFRAMPRRMIMGYQKSWYFYTAKNDFSGAEAFGLEWEEAEGWQPYHNLRDQFGHVTDMTKLEEAVELISAFICRFKLEPKAREC